MKFFLQLFDIFWDFFALAGRFGVYLFRISDTVFQMIPVSYLLFLCLS